MTLCLSHVQVHLSNDLSQWPVWLSLISFSFNANATYRGISILLSSRRRFLFPLRSMPPRPSLLPACDLSPLGLGTGRVAAAVQRDRVGWLAAGGAAAGDTGR